MSHFQFEYKINILAPLKVSIFNNQQATRSKSGWLRFFFQSLFFVV
uniref:Uncharacterized protein n=1 Tax=Rhizophora mucronata TaxID=61149 RepID=A0A2P2R256_RHIMU